jgi:endonuclease/exonuclease/phosphatase family metal-dependent hydrolase
MKIITWNCCLPPWSLSRKKKLPGIVVNILKSKADVICLQEVFFKKDADFIISELKTVGFSYHFYFKNLLTISKFPLSKEQSFIFESQGSIFSWAILDFFYKKGFQLIEIGDGTEKFCLVNTHLLSAYAFDTHKYQITREKQVEEICQQIDKQCPKGIIIGDFNFKPGTSPYQKVIKYNFHDPFDRDIRTVRKRRLDYIMLKNINYIETKVLFLNNSLSDHAALFISF